MQLCSTHDDSVCPIVCTASKPAYLTPAGCPCSTAASSSSSTFTLEGATRIGARFVRIHVRQLDVTTRPLCLGFAATQGEENVGALCTKAAAGFMLKHSVYWYLCQAHCVPVRVSMGSIVLLKEYAIMGFADSNTPMDSYGLWPYLTWMIQWTNALRDIDMNDAVSA